MGFEYLNARVRGWRSRLLKKADYDLLLSAPAIADLSDKFRATPYASYIEAARSVLGKQPEADIIEKGLKTGLQKSLESLWKNIPPESEGYFTAVLSYWDVYNLKTLLRGADKGVQPEEIFNLLLPGGVLDEGALMELSQARDARSIAEFLETWGSPYAGPVRDNLEQYMKDKDLMPVELALDRFLYNHCLNAVGGKGADALVIRALIRDRIDLTNITTLMKLSGERVLAADLYFIKGGLRLSEEAFKTLVNVKKMAGLLKGLAENLTDFKWRETVSSIDPEEGHLLPERLEGLAMNSLWRAAVTEPLGIALPVYFVHEKIREMRNLRAIARGKTYRVPEYEMRKYVIYV